MMLNIILATFFCLVFWIGFKAGNKYSSIRDMIESILGKIIRSKNAKEPEEEK